MSCFLGKEDEFHKSCELAGLDCPDGYECYCRPCIKAFEVDVFQWHDPNDAINQTIQYEGCSKMELCGEVQQTKEITFRIVDNLERDNAFVEVIVHLSDTDVVLEASALADPYTYAFSWTRDKVGVGIMEM